MSNRLPNAPSDELVDLIRDWLGARYNNAEPDAPDVYHDPFQLASEINARWVLAKREAEGKPPETGKRRIP